MKIGSVKIFLLVFFISISNIYFAESQQISNNEESSPKKIKGEIDAYLNGQYNRIFNYYGDISAIGSLELNNIFAFRLGFSLGIAGDIINVNTHTSAAVIPFSKIPFDFRVIYIYNAIPDYENNTHTILPLFSFNVARAGISLGPSLRFTSFFNEKPVFETIISFSAHINFINNDSLCIGISVSNFNEFQAKNFGAYSLKLNTTIRLNSQLRILNEFELSQSGGTGLSTAFLGFGWRGGVIFTW